MYVDANDLYGWAMSKKLPVDEFKWAGNISMFTEDFMKNYDEEGDVGYLLVVDTEYPKNFVCYIVIYIFCLRKQKLINALNLFVM